MNLPSGIDSNLVSGGNVQTRVVSRTVVHKTFASGGIGLFVDCALERNLLGDPRLKIAGIGFVYEKEVRRLGAGGDIGTTGRDTVLQVGAGDGFGVERLNVENDGNDVQFQPEAGAKVGCLVNGNPKFGSNYGEISDMHLAQKGHRDTSTKEFAEMLGGELAKSINDMRFDGVGSFFRIIGIDGDGLRREVGVVNRIVNRYGDLKA